ncbi:hypothetical protein QTP86_014723 [Hemibagrus guttatus]|nr:hypothetical protein QTP86_014723 [Hemibagrus guttatus]
MVTFPAVIEAGSDAKLCASLLKPNETLQMNVYLVHNNQNKTLLHETVEKDFHHCSHFEAPHVKGESVQEIKVEVKGESFKMTEKRKVMFKSYDTLGFIQTDKPIYNPGQTVNFRIVTMDSNFIPLKQKVGDEASMSLSAFIYCTATHPVLCYSSVFLDDSNHNRIGQWTNVSSTGLILQFSHELNAEAPQGYYYLTAKVEKRVISHHFKVEKYVLPKFEVTVKTPEEHSIGEEELKLEICGTYTYGQPVPGAALVQVCRKFRQHYFHHQNAPRISPCLVETVEVPGGPGNLITVNGTIKKEQYIKILNNNIRQSAEELGLGHQWTFQHYNDPKHTAKVVKKWLTDKNINVLQWPSQSPDLNPIENLWRELKIRVMARRPSNLKELELIAKDEWAKIPVETCKKLMSQTGCALHILNVSTFMNSEFEEHFEDRLNATVTLTEEGTEFSMVKSITIALSFQIGKVELVDLPKYFENGTVIKGSIKVTTFSGTPIPNKKVYLSEGHRWSQTLLLNLTTDSNGLANFSVPSPEHPKTEITLRASVYPVVQYHQYKTPFFSTAEKRIQLLQPATAHSPVFSELSIASSETPFKCGAEIPITINYYIVGETAESYSIDVIYMVLSKGAIVHHGHETVEVEESTDVKKGKVSFKLSVHAEIAPVVQVVAYSVLPSENIIASSKNFDVEKCFRNKVSLQFSPSEAVPGEKNNLEVSAHPGSLCGLSAVDQSVFILEPGNRLNTDERVGLKMATNLAIRVPRCLVYKGVEYHPESISYQYYGKSRPTFFILCTNYCSLKIDHDYNDATPRRGTETVRKFFPETWLWQLAEVGDSGSVQLPVTVPDTITTWETDAFCISSKGLGLAPPVQLTVFQPFFLELSLPYSIIRGEVFELKATVFNYISKCIMVKVTPAPSSDYTLEPSSEDDYSSCLCANGRKTFKWTLIPSVLGVLNVTVSAEAEQSQTVCDNEIVSVPERGRIDTVTRSLIVQAEGTEKTKSQSWLLCPQGNSVSEKLELTLPENVIEGSARASVSVLGDILGRALKNLDGLLKMPYGCGEQNIAILAPNIYILQYLESTGQLTSDIRERATGFLKSGYQRQLNYKHVSGGYSTFGSGEENTWLTAFVLRTFGKAQHYIFIYPEIINSAKKWLINNQRTDGCFIRQGSLFNNRMKGGVNDDVTITAYITASLLELGNPVQDSPVKKGLLCLKSSVSNLTNTYTTALLAYTFSLAGEKEIREQLLKELDNVAISGDGHLHWSQSALDESGSLSVEISSYVLLTVLTSDQLTAADLGYANRIVSWLVKQQNPYGGFSSTQDTVVALHALALYSTKVFSSEGSSTVTVKSADGHSHNFEVNQNNKLLYQERSLQDVPGKYSIDVKGSTCVSVQTALFYNVPTPTEISTLSITAKTEGSCTKSFGHTLSLNFTVGYNGELNSTNMIIVDIKLLSGFTADPGELKRGILVKRVDSKDDHIIMYIKELQKNIPINYELHIKQVLPVKSLKPALIKLYDYYQTSKIFLVTSLRQNTPLPVCRILNLHLQNIL